jgi:hypothetical protein
MMGNGRLNKIVCFYMLGTTEFKRKKVTALKLFHLTASPPSLKSWFFHIATQSQRGERKGDHWSLEFGDYL